MERDAKYWQDYVKSYHYNPNFMKNVPEEFQTQEMWNFYAKDSTSLQIFGIKNLVPYQFQTKEMWTNLYKMRMPSYILKIPREFQTQEMWELYLKNKRFFIEDLKYIPEEFQTQEMWNKAIEQIGFNPYYADDIPSKYLSMHIVKNVLKNEGICNYDYTIFKVILKKLEKQERDEFALRQSFITNQSRDYETGSRMVPYGEDDDYFEPVIPKKKTDERNRTLLTSTSERDYETGSRADAFLDLENERQM